MSLLLKISLGLISLAITVYFSACLWLYLRQTQIIFLPSATIETTPADFGNRFDDVWIPVGSAGEKLHGWWIPASGPETAVMLYLHGNGANIGANAEQANRFRQIGLSVLLIDYRGYGRSPGSPNEQQVYEDAEAGWQYLTQVRQVQPQRLFLYGHSLGGAIAIHLALQQPDAAGLIVQASFTSMRQMVDYEMPRSIFPIDLLLTQKFDSISRVSELKMPLLYIHGLNDLRVPARMSQQLYDASPDPKQLYLVPDAGHNNVAQVAGIEYLKLIQEFVQQNLNRSPTAAL